jgi:hypothetical protein
MWAHEGGTITIDRFMQPQIFLKMNARNVALLCDHTITPQPQSQQTEHKSVIKV